MGGSDNESLELTDFILGAFGAFLTLLNLIALYADMADTIRQAPIQMREAFGIVRQQLSEEREALTHQMRQSRQAHEQLHRRAAAAATAAASKRDHHNNNAESIQNKTNSGGGGGAGSGVVVLPLTYTDETLLLHYNTLKGLWLQFKELERPFLLPLDEVHLAESAAAYHLDRDDSWNTEDFRAARLEHPTTRAAAAPPKRHGSSSRHDESSHRGGGRHKKHKTPSSYSHKHEYLGPEDLESLYQCSFVHRFIWWRTKPDVKRLGEKVVKIMLRRMEREVTQTRLMVMQSRGMEFKYDGLYYENPFSDGVGVGVRGGGGGYDTMTVPTEHRRMSHRRSNQRGAAAVPQTAAAATDERVVRPRRASSVGPGPAVVVREERVYRQREGVDRGRQQQQQYYVPRQEAAGWWDSRGAAGGGRRSRSRSPRQS